MLQVLNGPVIAAGESVSDGIDCTAGPLVRITFPAQWGGGNLTFLISSDGNGYNDIYDAKGEPVTAVVRPGGAVRVPLEWSSMPIDPEVPGEDAALTIHARQRPAGCGARRMDARQPRRIHPERNR